MHNYKFNKEYLSLIDNSQLELLGKELNVLNKNKFIDFNINHRGYNVNNDNKISEIIDSKIQTIGFFSGAGGLDVGSQLAGAKVISSLDFDRDSVATMKSNKYFTHSKHIHKDIQECSAKDYSKIISSNNPEKLILVGGPPCQPFSKAGYWVTHKNRLGSEDPRNMIGQYLRLVDELKPDGFLLENVESLLHPKNSQAVLELKETIEKLGYHAQLVVDNTKTTQPFKTKKDTGYKNQITILKKRLIISLIFTLPLFYLPWPPWYVYQSLGF